jgi:hypothetical protein
MDPKEYRTNQLRSLTDEIGVYALCDLDEVPVYVGQSVDGIRTRVRRHLSSARSDVIANRQIDVWEIAYVWAWPVERKEDVSVLEKHLYQKFDVGSALMNGKALAQDYPLEAVVPALQTLQIIDEQERIERLAPSARLPRQISQYLSLVDYIQTVKDEPHLRKALSAHFQRLVKYHKLFLE